jgi:chemosensory pili system protein ChpA (sensor histidine kinase/response regulator)
MSTELTIQQRAVAAFAEHKTEKELVELAAKHVDIKAITNKDGRDQVHTARMALKNARIEVEAFGEKIRADAVQFGKGVIAEQRRLIGFIQPEETRLGNLQKEWDDAREAERQEKIAAEQRRIATLQARVNELRGPSMVTAASGTEWITGFIKDLEAIAIDESFQEFKERAEQEKAAGLERLRAIHASAVAYELEVKRIAFELAELARLREEQAKRAAAEIAAQEVEAKKLEADRAEIRRLSEALRNSQKAEAQPADSPKEALQPAAAPKLASKMKPTAFISPKFTAQSLIQALSNHYLAQPSTVLTWLRSIDWNNTELE